jgi:hypothetical protein
LSASPTRLQTDPVQRATRTSSPALLSSSQTTYGVPPMLAMLGSLASFLGSRLSAPPTVAHDEPSRRATRTCSTEPASSLHAMYGVPATFASHGSAARLLGSMLTTPPTLTHVPPNHFFT